MRVAFCTPSFSGAGLVGTLRPRLFFVRFGTGIGNAARDLGPRRSREEPRNVNCEAGGKVAGTTESSLTGTVSGSSDDALEVLSRRTGASTLATDRFSSTWSARLRDGGGGRP